MDHLEVDDLAAAKDAVVRVVRLIQKHWQTGAVQDRRVVYSLSVSQPADHPP